MLCIYRYVIYILFTCYNIYIYLCSLHEYLSFIDLIQVHYFFFNSLNFLHSSFIASSSRLCLVGVGQRSKRDFDIEYFGCQSTTTCTFKSPLTHTLTRIQERVRVLVCCCLLGPIASRVRLNAQIELGNWKRVVSPL